MDLEVVLVLEMVVVCGVVWCGVCDIVVRKCGGVTVVT